MSFKNLVFLGSFVITSVFSQENALPSFLVAQVDEDLKGLHLSKEAIDATWKQCGEGFVRYKGISGKLYAACDGKTKAHPRYVIVTDALEAVLSSQRKLDFDILVFLGDGLSDNTAEAPIFTFAKDCKGRGLILMPDSEALNPVDRKYLTQLIINHKKKIPWEVKKPLVFWRGAMTGPLPLTVQSEEDSLKAYPRFELVSLSKKCPERIDAAFVSWSPVLTNHAVLETKITIAAPVNPKDHLQYRYLIDVDGNSSCYSRTYWILLSNSLLLKQTTDNVQWFYKGLIPYTHFVPIAYDLSDLEEKMMGLDEVQIQAMIRAANAFAWDYLQYDSNLEYLTYLLQEYAKHLEDKPQVEGESLAKVPFYRKSYEILKGYFKKLLKTNPIS